MSIIRKKLGAFKVNAHIVAKLKELRYELTLYICNHIITFIPIRSVRKLFYLKVMDFKISHDVAIFMGCRFDTLHGLVIDSFVVISKYCRLDTRGGITIGKNVSLGEEVQIITADHDMADPKYKGRTKEVILGDYVSVGTRAMILPGCILGTGAVLGAGSILTKSIPDYEIWAGSPAKKIGDRNKLLTYTIKYNRIFH